MSNYYFQIKICLCKSNIQYWSNSKIYHVNVKGKPFFSNPKISIFNPNNYLKVKFILSLFFQFWRVSTILNKPLKIKIPLNFFFARNNIVILKVETKWFDDLQNDKLCALWSWSQYYLFFISHYWWFFNKANIYRHKYIWILDEKNTIFDIAFIEKKNLLNIFLDNNLDYDHL